VCVCVCVCVYVCVCMCVCKCARDVPSSNDRFRNRMTCAPTFRLNDSLAVHAPVCCVCVKGKGKA
jgi:hypothetical protein